LLGCIEGWRILSLAQRVGAGAQKMKRGLGDLFERLAQTSDDRLRQGLSRGAPDHDNVITQTKDGANQWVRVEFVGEIGSPLLMGLARNDFEARHCGANTILQLRDVRSIPTAGEHREPITKQIGEEAECAGSGADH
jgi:hypothetical protein